MTEHKPPKLPPPPRWATFINTRHPAWKFHVQRGMAKNAVGLDMGWSKVRPAELWEFVDSEWIKRFDTADYDHDEKRVREAMREIQ